MGAVRNLRAYRTWVFDCDGVILDSNPIKIEAYRQVASPYGRDVAEALVDFHVRAGGLSRYHKFAYLLETLLGGVAEPARINELSAQFAECMRKALRSCAVAEGLADLRAQIPDSRWMIVSGADQAELRELFSERGIAHYFEAGIFGSPDDKDVILQRQRMRGELRLPGLFVGDSRYDHEAARRAGLDFVFVSAWTDFAGWEGYAREHGLPVIGTIRELSAMCGEESVGGMR